jgi:cysteine desulfurase
MTENPIFYLDHCGTTPLSNLVKARLSELLNTDIFGNPSASHHMIGKSAEHILNEARLVVSKVAGCAEENVIFTGSASEANNLVLWGHALRFQGRSPRILFGATEHKSIYETCLAIADSGLAKTTQINVNSDGRVCLDHLENELKAPGEGPTLVALMHINNEIPARHPVEDISSLCQRYGASFHCDGVQGFVREGIKFSDDVFGSYVISPHKVYGPKGIGVLILGKNQISPRLSPAYRGGDQECGLRPGTHNTLLISAAATALSEHSDLRDVRVDHMHQCAKAFSDELLNKSNAVKLTLPITMDAAGIVNFYVENIDAPTLLARLPNLCMNRGSSCIGVGGEKFSHVPKALGLPLEIQANVLRASFGQKITMNESKEAASILLNVISSIKTRTE